MNGQTSHSRRELSRDLAECTSQAWKVYKSLAFAPESLKDVQAGALTLGAAWRSIVEFSDENQIPSVDERTIRDHITRSSTVIEGVNESLKTLRDGREEIENVAKFAQKLVIQAARITSFYEILRRPTQERILALLEEMREMKSEDFQQSRVRKWAFVLDELQHLGLSEDVVTEEYFFISDWLKGSYSGSHDHQELESDSIASTMSIQASGSSSIPRLNFLPPGAGEVEDELPGYTPGKKPANMAEKLQDLDRTAEILSLETPIDQSGSSSGALPPAYTFGTDGDQEMDEEFTHYIKIAIGTELKRRVYERDLHPERCKYPYSWLPKPMQTLYARRPETLSMLEGKSFTVMGYDTAPWCLNEIDRLLPILRISTDGMGDDSIFNDGVRTLKIMVSAMHKFSKIQDQRAGTELYSDLDILDYEASTAMALIDIEFPEHDFELAQNSYYQLLTYVMGMIALMKDIFPGKTYVTRSREDLQQLWRDRRMAARAAWIESQLAGWNHVEQAVLKCRDWHRLRPYLGGSALKSLQQWQAGTEILASHNTKDAMVLTIISATNIPKSRLGLPNIGVKAVLYGSSLAQAKTPFRRLEVFTEGAKNTQFPVWNKVIPFTCPDYPKMLDLEIYDRGMRDKEISRIRLNFTHIPGVERTFAGRDMMFGLDEEIRLPFKVHDGKGKETEQPILLIRLQWEGRFSLLENSGLLMSAPGKMFRPNITGIPLPFEDNQSDASICDYRSVRSGSSIASGSAGVGVGVVAGAVVAAHAANATLNVLGSL